MVAPISSILERGAIRVPSIARDTTGVQQVDIAARDPIELDTLDLEDPAILDQVEGVASSFLAGEVPADVLDRIEQTTAERGIQGGFGLGQASEFLTATSFGLTTLDLMDRGAELGLSVASMRQAGDLAMVEINNQREQFNENLNLSFAELQQSTSQWNDQMVAIMSDVRTNEQATNLAVLELASINTRFIQSQTTDMLIANSVNAIDGLQQNIDSLAESTGLSPAHLFALFGIGG